MAPRLCLNTASIKGAPLERQIALAHAAGFDGIGLWMDDIDAAAHGVRVALEFVGTAEEVKDLRAAWRLVDASGSANGGLLLDTFHFFLGSSTPEDPEAIPGERVFLVHVSDAMAVPREKLSTFHDHRTFPGDGTIDFAPVLDGLERLGYRGAVSLEIWNQELLKCDPDHGWLFSPRAQADRDQVLDQQSHRGRNRQGAGSGCDQLHHESRLLRQAPGAFSPLL